MTEAIFDSDDIYEEDFAEIVEHALNQLNSLLRDIEVYKRRIKQAKEEDNVVDRKRFQKALKWAQDDINYWGEEKKRGESELRNQNEIS